MNTSIKYESPSGGSGRAFHNEKITYYAIVDPPVSGKIIRQ
jgi:hypothetical protein